jgi:hypothetical protein
MSVQPAYLKIRYALLALTAGLGLLAAAPTSAQVANYPAGGPKLPAWSDLPDWDGLWERGGDIVWDDSLPHVPNQPQVPPFNDQHLKDYQARREQIRADAVAGRPRVLRGAGLYASMPAMMIMLFPMDVQINPHEVVIMTANGGAREIYTDGRQHPVDPLPSLKGHSIGHWEGKTLVVDTCCLRADTRLPGGGSHSDAMHITERIWALDEHTLKDAIVVEDSKAFTKPWTTVKTYYRRPDWEQVEYDLDENPRDFGRSPDTGNGSGPHAGGPDAAPASVQIPPAPPVQPKIVKLGNPATVEDLQKATAFAVGNLAWETVTVTDVQRSATEVKWSGVTRSVTWHCAAAPDGTKPFCVE